MPARCLNLLVAVLVLAGTNPANAGLGPENVMVVVNASSPDSLAIANKFIELRQIPSTNVVYLDSILINPKDPETISSKAFRTQILEPVTKAMAKRGLEDQIDCIAYSPGFPTRVNFSPEQKKYLQANGLKYDIHLHAPYGSLTSLTYFHHDLFSESPSFIELNSNRYAVPQVSSLLANPFQGGLATTFASATKAFDKGEFAKTIKQCSALLEQHPQQVVARYLLARSLAKNGENAKAIEQLDKCRRQGWCYREVTFRDAAFARIRGDERFKQVLEGMGDLPPGILPSRGFSAQLNWSQNGWPNGSPEQGQRYMLSTILAVTGRPKQSTSETALKQLERSAQADGTHPDGVFFFAKHGDVRSKIRHQQFELAAKELKAIGYETEISTAKIPKDNPSILGATLGNATIDWSKSGSRFVPGALCDNLTSYGAWWSKSQTKATHFLDAGAAGASGTVYEPYTIPPKFPNARLHVHYAKGCTLAEAFYQSVMGPFQLLIVGDPLCCPFGDFPEFEIKGPQPMSEIKSTFDFEIVPLPGSPEINHFDLSFDGRQLRQIDKAQKIRFAVDTLSDGYHEIRVAATGKTPVETKASRQFGFVLNRQGKSTKIETDKQKVKLGDELIIKGSSNAGKEIEIWQNSRVVGKITDGQVTIDSGKLGQGKVKLQGVVISGDQTTKSVPVEVEILP